MENEGHEAMLLAAIFALVPIAMTILLVVVGARAANGRLQRNPWVGIRGPSTMRTDQAWMAGHRASLRLVPLYLFITIAVCAALFAAAYTSTPGVVMLIGLGGFGAVVALLVYTAFFAARAARAADDRSDDDRQSQ
jgi:hypothetical protein